MRKLELEGNLLGTETAKAFGKALRINTTLKALDLENNSLCGEGNYEGMIEFIKALETNTSLISLNIGNNKLEEPIGEQLRSMLDKNDTLIDLEIGFNSFSLEDVSEKYLFKLNVDQSYSIQVEEE